jgi:hypothetical protein
MSTLVIFPDDAVAAGVVKSGTPLIWDKVRRIPCHSPIETVLTSGGRSTLSGMVKIVVEILTSSAAIDSGERKTRIEANYINVFIVRASSGS